MNTIRQGRGFTLIELMVVVAIVGILAAFAFPLYQNYMERSANNACLAEAKAYVNFALSELHANIPVTPPEMSACSFIAAPESISDIVSALPKMPPGSGSISCNMEASAACMLVPD